MAFNLRQIFQNNELPEHHITWEVTTSEGAKMLKELDTIPSADEGIDYERVRNFIARRIEQPYGIRFEPPRTLFLDRFDPRYWGIIHQEFDASIPHGVWLAHPGVFMTCGFYHWPTHSIYIVRDRIFEHYNGTLGTEGLFIHELAHSIARMKKTFWTGVEAPLRRLNAHNGVRFEEAVASYWRVQYFKEQSEINTPAQLLLTDPNNIVDAEQNLINFYGYPVQPYPLSCHLYIHHETGILRDSYITPYKNAARVQALIYQVEAGILDIGTIMLARQWDKEAIKQVEKDMKRVHPGLWQAWMNPNVHESELHKITKDLLGL